MTGPRVVDTLFVDLGEGFEIKNGDRAGQIKYTRPPRARYECVRCGHASPIVTGAPLVRDFVANQRTDHRAICPAIHRTTNQQGAKAA